MEQTKPKAALIAGIVALTVLTTATTLFAINKYQENQKPRNISMKEFAENPGMGKYMYVVKDRVCKEMKDSMNDTFNSNPVSSNEEGVKLFTDVFAGQQYEIITKGDSTVVKFFGQAPVDFYFFSNQKACEAKSAELGKVEAWTAE